MGASSESEKVGERLRAAVEEEATAAEADDELATDEPVDDPVDEPGDEPVDEPEDEPADQGMSMERQAKMLGKLVDGFEAGLRELFEVDEPLTQVPMDGAIGFMLPGALELKSHDKFRRCSTCNGHGQVLTGSLADQRQTADCPRCGGRGYLEKLEGETPASEQTNGNVVGDDDPDAGFGVPKWMGDPGLGQT